MIAVSVPGSGPVGVGCWATAGVITVYLYMVWCRKRNQAWSGVPCRRVGLARGRAGPLASRLRELRRAGRERADAALL